MSILISGYSRQCANQIHVDQDHFGGIRVLSADGTEIAGAVVADGVSLGFQGKYASYNTTLWFLEWCAAYLPRETFDPQGIAQEIQTQMVQYNQRLNAFSDDRSDKDTCCTVCGMLTDGKQVLIFNAGDSRLYELTASAEVRCMTRDDKAEDGYSIAMHIGGKNDEEIQISFSVEEFHEDSLYILCTDGFYKRCRFQDVLTALMGCYTREETVAILEKVVDALVESGEKDDITAVVLGC